MNEIIDAILKHFEVKNIEAKNIIGGLDALFRLSKESDYALEKLKNIGKSVFPFEQLNFAGPVPDAKIAALSIYLIHFLITSEESITVESIDGNNQGKEVYKILMDKPRLNSEAIETLQEYTKISIAYDDSNPKEPLRVLYEFYDKSTRQNFAEAVLQELAKRDDHLEYFTAARIRRFYYKFQRHLGQEFIDTLLDESLRDPDFIDNLMAAEFSLIRPQLYIKVLAKVKEPKVLEEFLVDGFQYVDRNWKKLFASNNPKGYKHKRVLGQNIRDDLARLLIYLSVKGFKLNLREKFLHLFIDYIKGWEKEVQFPEDIKNDSKFLFRALDPQVRGNLPAEYWNETNNV